MANISTDQANFLKTVATLAYGSGSSEGAQGGKGHMALINVDGQLRVIKCNTHASHADKVQNAINASDQAAQLRQQLIDGSKLLSEKLCEIGRSLGLTDVQLKDVRASAQNGKTLLTRKTVAAFVNAAKDTGDQKLARIWTDAKNNAVKSNFSMTFEKVSGANATDFHGKIDRHELTDKAQMLTELDRTLGLSDGDVFRNRADNPIRALSQKLSDGHLLTSDDEALLEHLAHFHPNADTQAPFGNDALNKLLTDAYEPYGGMPGEDDLSGFRASDDLHETVVDILVGKKDMKALSELAEKTAHEKMARDIEGKLNGLAGRGLTPPPFDDSDEGVLCNYVQILGGSVDKAEQLGLSWLNDPSVTLQKALEDAVRGEHVTLSDNTIEVLAEAIAKDQTFIDGLADLLQGKETADVRNFGDLVKAGFKRHALNIVHDKLKETIEDPNAANFKAILDFAQAATSDKISDELKKEFLNACDRIGFAASKNRALGIDNTKNNPDRALAAAQEFIAVLNDVKDVGIGIPDAPEFFSESILKTCDELADALTGKGLTRTGENLKDLTGKLRNNRVTDNYKALCIFLNRLKLAGLCDDAIATHASLGTKTSVPFQKQIDTRLKNSFPLLPVDDRKFLLAELTKKFAPVVDTEIMGKTFKSNSFENILKQANDFDETCIALLQKRDKDFMSRVKGYDNVLGQLSKNGKGVSQVSRSDAKDTLVDSDTGTLYRRINVGPGRSLGQRKYAHLGDQSCLLHSVLNGLGYDVTRENGLILRQALNNFINACLQKIPSDKPNPFNRKSCISDFIRMFNPKYTSDDTGPGTLLSEEFYNGKAFDITAPSLTMSDSFVPFLATMLNRPITLAMPMLTGGKYEWALTSTFDFDVMTGEKLKSNDPPLTIMYNSSHFQSLELIENGKKIPQPKIEAKPVAAKPAPKDAQTQAPKNAQTQAPKKTEAPTPKKTETPAPKKTETPAPVKPAVTTQVTDDKSKGLSDKIDAMLKEAFLDASTEGFDMINKSSVGRSGTAVPEEALDRMISSLFKIKLDLIGLIANEYPGDFTKADYDNVAKTMEDRVFALLYESNSPKADEIVRALIKLQDGEHFDDLAMLVSRARLVPSDWPEDVPKIDAVGFCVGTALFNGIAKCLLTDMATSNPYTGIFLGFANFSNAKTWYGASEYSAYKYLKAYM